MKQILTLFIFLFLSLPAQQQSLRFERISIEQGLSQSSVFSIAQDQQGFLWFATQEGLNRYDGYTFTIFRHSISDSSSISDNYINTVFVDHHGRVWAGTQFGGLNRFDRQTDRFIPFMHSENDPHSISSNYILPIYEDRRNTFWVGTINGLNRFNESEKSFDRYYFDSSFLSPNGQSIVHTMYEDRNGRFWIGSHGSILLFNREQRLFSRSKTEIPVTLAKSFVEDSLGRLWSLTSEGLFYFSGKEWILERALFHPGEPLQGEGMIKDIDNIFWIGTKNGLLRFDPYTKAYQRFTHNPLNQFSLSGNTALSLFEDRTGIIWVGTFDGISKYAPRLQRFHTVALSLDKIKNSGWNKIRSFREDREGILWVATQEGLLKYHRETGRMEHIGLATTLPIDIDGTNTIWSLELRSGLENSSLWLGTNGKGLINFTPERTHSVTFTAVPSDSQQLSSNTIWSLLEDRAGNLWIGTLMEGLNEFDPVTKKFRRYKFDENNPNSLSNNTVWSLFQDRKGILWVGTAGGGLNKFVPEKNSFIRYRHNGANPHSLSDDKITSITEDKAGMLWIGTYAGLNRFDPNNETFKTYTMKEGLPNEVIYAIVHDDNGDLWLSTNKGLSKFNSKTETFRNYDAGDGLQGNEFNMGAALKLRSGELLFGGINGFNIFHPGKIVNNPFVPPVVITGITVDGTPVNSAANHDTLVLSYADALFSIRFAALDYTNPQKNNYAYMLEGFNRQWTLAGLKREATYTNIGPGEYLFRMKGSNNDGVWNETGTSLRIIITPPWWGTWWFRSIVILGFLSIGPIIYFRRVSTLKKKNLQQQEFSRQLIESQEQERKRIAAELHDSVGQDLLIIKNKLLYETENESQQRTSGLQDVIEYISKSLKNVREISRNLRPIQLDQLGLTAALESVIETVAESSRINFTTQIDNIDNTLTKENEINLFRIVQECLNNILKHSQATEASIEIKKNVETLVVTVKDNGIGIEASSRPQPARPAGGRPVGNEMRGFGMSSMKERAHILGGELRIDSKVGEGTVVVIRILQEKLP